MHGDYSRLLSFLVLPVVFFFLFVFPSFFLPRQCASVHCPSRWTRNTGRVSLYNYIARHDVSRAALLPELTVAAGRARSVFGCSHLIISLSYRRACNLETTLDCDATSAGQRIGNRCLIVGSRGHTSRAVGFLRVYTAKGCWGAACQFFPGQLFV